VTPTGVSQGIGHVRRNQRSRWRNPFGHIRRYVGHVPGITGHVEPEYAVKEFDRELGRFGKWQLANDVHL
jgi:hypothetical protein